MENTKPIRKKGRVIDINDVVLRYWIKDSRYETFTHFGNNILIV